MAWMGFCTDGAHPVVSRGHHLAHPLSPSLPIPATDPAQCGLKEENPKKLESLEVES